MGPVSLLVGSIRIVPVESIVHPVGDPSLDGNAERRMRREVVQKALKVLTSEKV
jgi:betaine reductase